MLKGILKSMRPHQWVKNGFVLAPLVFAQELDNPPQIVRSLAAFLLFCAVSSAVYLMNDCFDVEKDRAHPVKRFRPIPAGIVPVHVARNVSIGLALSAVGCGFVLAWPFGLATLIYLVVNFAYSTVLKHVAYIDVLVIAFGFLVRVVSGGLAIDVAISNWLLACTFLVSLYLAMGKRRHELANGGVEAIQRRKVLQRYNPAHLHVGMVLGALLTTAAYTAYATSEHARALFGTQWFPVTIPFIIVGMVRFYRLTGEHDDATSPTERMVRDPTFLVNLLAWCMLVLVLIYGGNG